MAATLLSTTRARRPGPWWWRTPNGSARSWDQPHVFERFYQADASRDRARGASGLGLAIVKAITEAMGGRVGVESTPAPGADSWVELPAA